jgi:hypothetical protein
MANIEDTNIDDIFDNDSEYIIIPNPIYDVVFRYLMEDEQSAIIVISTLINQKIISLEAQPLTHSEKKQMEEDENGEEIENKRNKFKTKDSLLMFHLDFKAVIELENGEREIVMIELQKATAPSDIFRFKRYISRNFQQKQNKEIIDPITKDNKIVEAPIRLIPIFILNFIIEEEINDVLIKTTRVKEGVFKNKNLVETNEFIDNLTYDMYVVQLPNLHKISEEEYQDDDYKIKLYALLKIFDQKSKIKDNIHRVRVMRRFFPSFMKRLIRRLQAAEVNNIGLEEEMFREDEHGKDLRDKDDTINSLLVKFEKKEEELIQSKEVITQKDEELVQSKEVINQKDEELIQSKEIITQKDEVITQKDEVILGYAKFLKTQGSSIEEIKQKTGLSIDKLEDL